MSTRRRCDVISLEAAHLYHWVAYQGLNSYLCLNWPVFLAESNLPLFSEHNMRFLFYSAVLCIQINRFQSEGQA